MSAKRTALNIHIWAGIILGALWSLQGLTGAMLIFHREVQQAVLEPRTPIRASRLDRVFIQASIAVHAPVTRIERFGAGTRLVLAYYERDGRDRVAVFDKPSGRIVDDRDPDALLPDSGSFWPWLLRLHEGLLGGDVGQMVTGTSGLLLLSSLMLGAWNAWPARHRWRELFRTSRWRSPMQKLTGWHRMIGMLVLAPLALIATCGIYLAFAPELRPLLAAGAGYQRPFKAKPVAELAPNRISAQQALLIVKRRFPGATFVRAVMPTPRSPVYLFRMLQPRDLRRWAGTSVAVIDPWDGHIIAAYDSYTGPIANRLTDDLYPIHTGEIAGPLGRLATMLAGLALPALYAMGLLNWLKRRALRKRIRPLMQVPARATIEA